MTNPFTPPYDMIIVHYRDPVAVDGLIRQARGWTCPPRAIVVADNSADYAPSADIAESVEVIRLPNPGYGAAINAGLNVLGDRVAEYVLFATQDAAAAADAIQRMIGCLQAHPEAAVAAPLLAFRSDPAKVFSAGGIVDAKGRTYHAGFRAPVEQWTSRPDLDVAWADGAVLLVRTRALQSVGGFREEFFLYYEEVEFQLRLRLHGWSVRLVPTALCGQEPGNLTAYLRVRNRMLLTKAFPYYFDQRLRFSLLEAVRACAISLRDKKFTGVLWAWRGLWDGMKGRVGHPPRSLTSRWRAPAGGARR
jgi:GT2 family glycosyltransferase